MPNKRMAKASRVLFHRDAQMRILRFLWRSRAEWSGREIARKVGLSAPACHETLKKIHARGLAQFRRVSNVHLYKINPESYLVRNLFARLFAAEAAMPKEMLAVVKKSLVESPKSEIVSLVLFGSMARDARMLGSDLDLLVVLPTKESLKDIEPRIERLRASLFRRFNVPLSPYIQTVSELRQKYQRKLPLVREILKEGHTIYGKDIREVVA